jgi:hypothetical protein
VTHIGPTGDMPYDRKLYSWPHPGWLAVSVWKAVALVIGIIVINLSSFVILLALLKGFRP